MYSHIDVYVLSDTAAKLLTMCCICDVFEHASAPAKFGGITSVITHILCKCACSARCPAEADYFLFYG